MFHLKSYFYKNIIIEIIFVRIVTLAKKYHIKNLWVSFKISAKCKIIYFLWQFNTFKYNEDRSTAMVIEICENFTIYFQFEQHHLWSSFLLEIFGPNWSKLVQNGQKMFKILYLASYSGTQSQLVPHELNFHKKKIMEIF